MNSSLREDALYMPSLNYFSLLTVGRVRIRLVDTVTAHLAFDRPTRTLSIFRFPTFCVTNVHCSQGLEILQRATSELLPPVRDSLSSGIHKDDAPTHRELLLTYRILFGQSSRSRKLLEDILDAIQEPLENIDPFLRTICTSPLSHSFIYPFRKRHPFPTDIFPSSSIGPNNGLLEPDVYSVESDFPVFGLRLLMLQRFIMTQQPSRVRDMWHDRRNPLQWYTFWAVLWVGGASILLGVLQLLVASAQLYFSICPRG